MFKIAIDAGHGLYTAGKRCLKSIDPNETREWVLNSRIAGKVIEKLKRKQEAKEESQKTDEVLLLEEIRDLLKNTMKEEK